MEDRAVCPVCAEVTKSLSSLAAHLVDRAEESDAAHVMWLNRHVTKHRMPAEELQPLLAAVLAGAPLPGPRVRR
jgi:hypothetical protein